ncbi:bifunctional DNA primase/polymerase [Pseudonocardia halophobica]|uniref:bifunctional DNA primase/polymerase n=1 Tax=Pseudonocardia halophobica TaxID=29401 RepID=UPI003D9337A3
MPPSMRPISDSAADFRSREGAMVGSDLLHSALAHAARGWRVFPLRPGDKRPAIRDWEARATTNPERIRRAWAGSKRFNIGIACGPSRLVVVDLDTPEHGVERPPEWDRPGIRDGADVLAALAERNGQTAPFETYAVETASVIWGRYSSSQPRQGRCSGGGCSVVVAGLSAGRQRGVAVAGRASSRGGGGWR